MISSMSFVPDFAGLFKEGNFDENDQPLLHFVLIQLRASPFRMDPGLL
jgi:hypothetical protein